MRQLSFDFPKDDGGYRVDDPCMFGPDLQAAPVLHEGALARGVSAWTDEVFQGGQTITADAPLKHLPLYLRGEKVLPIKA